jgi:hypothetical protein
VQPSSVEITIWRVLTDRHYRQRLLSAADLAVNGCPLARHQIQEIRSFDLQAVCRAENELAKQWGESSGVARV